MNTYTRDYYILGVPENCSLDVLKAARRRLVKSWHPDRFPTDGEMKRQAEERIKDINTAFEHLIDHYKRYGTLPTPSADTNSSAATDRRSDNANDRSPVDSFSQDFTPPVRPSFKSTVVRATLLLVALLISAEIGRVVFTQGRQSTDTSTPSSTLRSNPVLSTPSSPIAAAPKYFTIGSTLGEVYATQGAPLAIENGVWRYGKSSVYFTDGLVTSWEEDPETPLKTTLLPSSSPQVPETFTVGSTKAEVRAIEGAPLVETSTLWDYGLSKVHFRDDRVVSWENSPMRPLKVRRP